MNRSGNFADVVEYMSVALSLGITIVIVLLFMTNWGSNIRAMNDSTIPSVVKNSTLELETYTARGFDYLFLFVYLIFLSFSVVMARLIPSSSKFILVSVFVLIVLPFASLIIENVWFGLASNASLGVVVSSMVFLPFMMDHLVWFVTLYCVAVAVALLTKDEVSL